MTGKRKRVKADEGKQFVLSSSHHSVDEQYESSTKRRMGTRRTSQNPKSDDRVTKQLF